MEVEGAEIYYPKMKKPENLIQVSLQLIKDLKGKTKRPEEPQKLWVAIIQEVPISFSPCCSLLIHSHP